VVRWKFGPKSLSFCIFRSLELKSCDSRRTCGRLPTKLSTCLILRKWVKSRREKGRSAAGRSKVASLALKRDFVAHRKPKARRVDGNEVLAERYHRKEKKLRSRKKKEMKKIENFREGEVVKLDRPLIGKVGPVQPPERLKEEAKRKTLKKLKILQEIKKRKAPQFYAREKGGI